MGSCIFWVRLIWSWIEEGPSETYLRRAAKEWNHLERVWELGIIRMELRSKPAVAKEILSQIGCRVPDASRLAEK